MRSFSSSKAAVDSSMMARSTLGWSNSLARFSRCLSLPDRIFCKSASSSMPRRFGRWSIFSLLNTSKISAVLGSSTPTFTHRAMRSLSCVSAKPWRQVVFNGTGTAGTEDERWRSKTAALQHWADTRNKGKVLHAASKADGKGSDSRESD